jgi:hypothetical protein
MLRTSLILATSILATNIAWADQPLPGPARTDSEQAAIETESQQFARARLMEMASFLGSREKFGVTMRAGYEVVQDSGQKIEFGEIRELVVQRPDHVRVTEVASHGGQNLMLFDGKQITMFDGETGLFAQAPQPGDIDTTVVHFVRDLKMRLPLAPMLMQRFAEELQRRVQSLEYVEYTDIMGEPAYHIVARTESVNFQVWIADTEQPLPQRIVMNYPLQEGHPQFWANFSKWDLSPTIDKTTFEFKPPADAQQILFSAEFIPVSSDSESMDIQNQGDKP